MVIRQLVATDAPTYRRLMLSAYQLAPDAFTSTPEERSKESESWWVNRIANPTGLSAAFGAFMGDNLVGAVALEFNEKPKTRHKAHLIGMFVEGACRGMGAGRSLVDAAIEYMRSRSELALVTLTVTEGNEAAIRLYQAHGFQEFGIEPMAICTPSGYKSKVHMALRLAHNEPEA